MVINTNGKTFSILDMAVVALCLFLSNPFYWDTHLIPVSFFVFASVYVILRGIYIKNGYIWLGLTFLGLIIILFIYNLILT